MHPTYQENDHPVLLTHATEEELERQLAKRAREAELSQFSTKNLLDALLARCAWRTEVPDPVPNHSDGALKAEIFRRANHADPKAH